MSIEAAEITEGAQSKSASYATPVKQWDVTPCCGATPEAVYYNAYNRVIQCHACGHVWEPKL